LTLPFVSYGGTSLVANLIGVGILLHLSTHAERR
jgi:cell division protein FtsW (lipid II flippase)